MNSLRSIPSRPSPLTATAPVAKPAHPAPLPSESEIRARAFEKYCARNGSNGDALSDWLEAERELREFAQRGPNWKPTLREKSLLTVGNGGSDPVC